MQWRSFFIPQTSQEDGVQLGSSFFQLYTTMCWKIQRASLIWHFVICCTDPRGNSSSSLHFSDHYWAANNGQQRNGVWGWYVTQGHLSGATGSPGTKSKDSTSWHERMQITWPGLCRTSCRESIPESVTLTDPTEFKNHSILLISYKLICTAINNSLKLRM